MVYAVKGSIEETTEEASRKGGNALSQPSSNSQASKTDAITLIRNVKALAANAGGYEKLEKMVETFAR